MVDVVSVVVMGLDDEAVRDPGFVVVVTFFIEWKSGDFMWGSSLFF